MKKTSHDEKLSAREARPVKTVNLEVMEKEEAAPDDSPHQNLVKSLWRGYLERKKLAVPLTVLLVFGVVFGIPWSRYKVLGLTVKKSFSVIVVDSKTGKPVSEAEVSLAGRAVKTDGEGKAIIEKNPVGSSRLAVKKKYYRDHDEKVLVALGASKNNKEIRLEATGRQVPLSITNKISGQGLKGVKITVLDIEAEADEKGEATIVLPADKVTEKVTLRLNGYNDTTAEIDISEQLTDKNKLSLTPSGKLYFLSKRSGKIDVVKTNLDGSDRQVVLAGTGKEQEASTILLASRDWKYLALHTRREGDKAKLYLIDTSNDKLTVMDEGNAFFDVVGWKDDSFVFIVNRQNVPEQHPKRYALKAFSASKKSLNTLDETDAIVTRWSQVYQTFDRPYITKQGIVYVKRWYAAGYVSNVIGKEVAIALVRSDGSGKKDLKTFPAQSINYIDTRSYAPDEIYFFAQQFGNIKPEYFEYEDGVVKPANIDSGQFEQPYPTFLFSPSGNATFWAEPRDGKNTLFVGDASGKEAKEINTASELTAYGWHGEDYLLASKKGSELFILSKEKNATPLKITDYHKPNFDAAGYGYGYGGL